MVLSGFLHHYLPPVSVLLVDFNHAGHLPRGSFPVVVDNEDELAFFDHRLRLSPFLAVGEHLEIFSLP